MYLRAEEMIHREYKQYFDQKYLSRDTSDFEPLLAFSTMPADFDTFRSILLYCMALLAFPIATLFLTKFILFDGLLQLDSVHSNVYSAISAVIMLHINLGIFIYKAYSSDTLSKKPEKID